MINISKHLNRLNRPNANQNENLNVSVWHFLHIGKTGGSSIKHALANHLIKDGITIQLHRHSTTLNHVPPGEKVFFFLRDPIDRFVSAFNSRLRRGQPRTFRPWSLGEEMAFKRFTTADQLANSLPHPDAINAMNAIFHVKNRYWEWLIDEATLTQRQEDVLFVGFLETIDDDFQQIKSLLGLPDTLNIPDDPIVSHKTPPWMNQALSARGRENIKNWVQEDYRAIEVCRRLFRPDTVDES